MALRMYFYAKPDVEEKMFSFRFSKISYFITKQFSFRFIEYKIWQIL